MMLVYCLCVLVCSTSQVSAIYLVNLNTTGSGNSVDESFLSVTIDIDTVQNNWYGFNFSSPKMQNLAKALSPCDLRFGGTAVRFLHFLPNSSSPLVPGGTAAVKFFNLTGQQWDSFTRFVRAVGWNLILDLNILWNSSVICDLSNADLLLNYSAARNIPIVAFELGNEVNAYPSNFNITVTPAQLVNCFLKLRNLTSKYSQYKNSSLHGPGVTENTPQRSAMVYLKRFLQAGGGDSVDEICVHHYYLGSAGAQVQTFLNLSVLNSFTTVNNVVLNLTKTYSPSRHVRLSETASMYGGGAWNMSNNYVAGFLWLDKLGLSAQSGLTRVCRQDFIGASYNLVTARTFLPRPDFFLSVLFKRLVKGNVLSASSTPGQEQLRLYANCARRDIYNYPDGAVVVYFLNLANEDADLSFGQFPSQNLELFLLTPGDGTDLKSSTVKLNGNILRMSGDNLPQMTSVSATGTVRVQAQSFGFIVVPNAGVPACKSSAAVVGK